MHRTRRDQPGYDGVAQTLHWLTLILLVIQYGLAWSASDHLSSTDSVVSLHLSFGLVVLVVALARLVWRACRPAPEPPSDLPAWQRVGAHVVQILLYGLLVALPVLGWLWAGARGWTVSIFGLVTLPDLAGRGSTIGHVAGDLHALLSNVLLALVGLHVVGALYHAVFRRDGVMQRMLPASRRST
jgi:cytochrome b561